MHQFSHLPKKNKECDAVYQTGCHCTGGGRFSHIIDRNSTCNGNIFPDVMK